MKLVELLRKHRYELIALLTGAAVMMLEIVGARLIAPYFGASTYVWTAMIGVILAALSFGFWFGGRLADRDEPGKDLSIIIAGAAFLVLIMAFLQVPVLDIISRQQLDLRVSAVLAAVVLFGAPSVLIGMVSPHLAKIRVTSLKTTGAAVGRLEAAGAIGSIMGTFLSGYFLLAYFGARNLTIWLAVLLVITSFIAGRRQLPLLRLSLVVIAVLLLAVNPLPKKIVKDIDSAYSRYQVEESIYNSRPVHFLLTDSYSIQSAAYIDDPTEPVLNYAKAMFSAAQSHPNPEHILVIGGGTYTLPTALQAHLPNSQIDVVEIDPALDDLASDYFGFKPGPNMQVIHEDGRSYLNRNDKKYDLIFVDAYSSLTPPFQLSSQEAIARMAASLSESGLVVANAATEYDSGFLPSLIKTYGSVFGTTNTYQANPAYPLRRSQNFLVLSAPDKLLVDKVARNLGPAVSLSGGGVLLTDDYAPVERLSF